MILRLTDWLILNAIALFVAWDERRQPEHYPEHG